MARIAGIDIPREKRVEVALTYIYGIGLPTSKKILEQTSINPDTRVRDLTEEQVNRLREVVDRNHKVEGDLRREVALNVKRLIEIGSYRGLRHRRGLPDLRHGARRAAEFLPRADVEEPALAEGEEEEAVGAGGGGEVVGHLVADDPVERDTHHVFQT